VGFLLNAVFIWILWGWPWWTGFVTAPVVLALGYVREKIQHKWQRLEWPHQVVEAVTWGLGALLAALVGVGRGATSIGTPRISLSTPAPIFAEPLTVGQ
jgi:hypothetical protein